MPSYPKSALPKFSKPPVTEVVLAVQFAPLTNMRATHFGAIYQKLGSHFPEVREMTPLDRLNEVFGEGAWQPQGLKFEIGPIPAMPRLWLLNDDGSKLLQIQRDRLAHNWRRVTKKQKYPSFEKIFPEFSRNLRAFSALMKRQDIGNIKPDMVEVIYVNTIGSQDFPDCHGSISKMIAPWSNRHSDKFLSHDKYVQRLETGSFTNKHIIFNEGGDPTGRLRISAQPALDKIFKGKAILLKLSARIILDKPTIKSALENISFGHEVVVQAFASMTTKRMHKTWGRKR